MLRALPPFLRAAIHLSLLTVSVLLLAHLIGWLPDFFTPRFQLGGVVNLAGRTSFVHADLLWTTNWTQRLFSEMFAGVTVHNGNLDSVDEVHNALGCRALLGLRKRCLTKVRPALSTRPASAGCRKTWLSLAAIYRGLR